MTNSHTGTITISFDWTITGLSLSEEDERKLNSEAQEQSFYRIKDGYASGSLSTEINIDGVEKTITGWWESNTETD